MKTKRKKQPLKKGDEDDEDQIGSEQSSPAEDTVGYKQGEHRKQYFDFIKRVWNQLPCSQAKVFSDNPLAYRLRTTTYNELVTALSEIVHDYLFHGLHRINWNGRRNIQLLTPSGMPLLLLCL
jgi:hypothetical protein